MTPIRRAVVQVLVAAGLFLLAVPVAAVETSTYGADPYPRERDGVERQSFRIEVAPGAQALDTLQIWNPKETGRITLKLVVQSATRSGDELELGTGEGSQWVGIEHAEVTVEAQTTQLVDVTVDLPSDVDVDSGPYYAAIVLTPLRTEAVGLAVLDEVTMPITIVPVAASDAGDASDGGLSLALAALAGLLLLLTTALTASQLRARSAEGQSPDSGAATRLPRKRRKGEAVPPPPLGRVPDE